MDVSPIHHTDFPLTHDTPPEIAEIVSGGDAEPAVTTLFAC
jgi:hypothetical protein